MFSCTCTSVGAIEKVNFIFRTKYSKIKAMGTTERLYTVCFNVSGPTDHHTMCLIMVNKWKGMPLDWLLPLCIFVKGLWNLAKGNNCNQIQLMSKYFLYYKAISNNTSPLATKFAFQSSCRSLFTHCALLIKMHLLNIAVSQRVSDI